MGQKTGDKKARGENPPLPLPGGENPPLPLPGGERRRGVPLWSPEVGDSLPTQNILAECQSGNLRLLYGRSPLRQRISSAIIYPYHPEPRRPGVQASITFINAMSQGLFQVFEKWDKVFFLNFDEGYPLP
ncbi:MAG: hypothetical protein EA395_02320 [Phormidium sp. GEM2.Bin31]|nr:MAG: hypothetical protein EA395_02320 [Phormidium sp. GEM2.Bin31]